MDKDTKVALRFFRYGETRFEGVDAKSLKGIDMTVGNTLYRINSANGKVRIMINGNLHVMPVASNVIELEEEDYHAN